MSCEIEGRQRVAGAHGLGGGQVTAAGEHGQPLEDPLLVVEEQLVAPIDHRPQRLLTRERRARPAGEQAEPVVQTRGQVCWIGNARVRAAASSMASGSPSRRVQMPAITREVIVGGLERCADVCGAGDEELDGVVRRERRHRPDGLAADSQPLAAGGDDAQAGAAAQEVLGDLGGRPDHVLAVVEHQEHLPIADHLRQSARVREVERRSDRGADAGWIADGSQLHQAPAERQVRGLEPGHLEREACLAHSTGPDERHEAMVGHEAREVAQLLVASDQRGQRFRDGRARLDARCGRVERRSIEGSILGQDRRLQPAQLVSRLETELLAEDVAALLEDPERVGLPSGAVQGDHQQAAEALSQRMRGRRAPRARTIAPWWRPSWSSRSSRSSITASRSSDRRVMAAAAKSS